MAFHLLTYAALYHGAARRTEQWIISLYASGLEKLPAENRPQLDIVYKNNTQFPSAEWRQILPQDFAATYGKSDIQPPPFLMLWRNTGDRATWAMVPEGMFVTSFAT